MTDIVVYQRRGRSLVIGLTNTGLRWLRDNMVTAPPYFIDTDLVEDFIQSVRGLEQEIIIEVE